MSILQRLGCDGRANTPDGQQDKAKLELDLRMGVIIAV
jgi:hypothetical protein